MPNEDSDWQAEKQASNPNPDPAPDSPDAPGVNFVNRVTGVVRITGEEPIEETS